MSMSFKDLPLLYGTLGGYLNISLSCGCCWIKCHLCISICLRLDTIVRYCVTNDKIRLSFLHFCRKAIFLSSNLMSESIALNRLSGYPRSIRCALKCKILVLNSFSEELFSVKSKCFALYEALFFLPLRVCSLQSAICILISVCVLPPVCSLRFTLTGFKWYCFKPG